MTKDDAHPHDGARSEDAPHSKKSPKTARRANQRRAEPAAERAREPRTVPRAQASDDRSGRASDDPRTTPPARQAAWRTALPGQNPTISRRRLESMIELAQSYRGWSQSAAERDWRLDAQDVRVLAGTMGRFPGFRRTGWRILDAVRAEERGRLP